jgi:Fibronectin type III domain/FG-GAP-like repeat
MKAMSFFTILVVLIFSFVRGEQAANSECTIGEGEFYTTDGQANLRLQTRYNDWSETWDRIIPGNFGGSGVTDLLFYDRATGEGRFYTLGAQGNLTLLRRYTGWRTTWDQIIPGNFGGDALTDLLFYDRAGGQGEFYVNGGQGNFPFLRRYEGWRTTWDQIISGDFSGDGHTDLLFYDRADGQGEFYTNEGQGNFSFLRRYEGWRNTWYSVIPGNFGGDEHTDLLFYDKTPRPPLPPKGLFDIARTSNSISVVWTNQSTCQNGFKVYYRQGRQGRFTLAATLNSPNQASYTLTGLAPDTEYCFMVSAFSSAGESSNNEVACAQTAPRPNPEYKDYTYDMSLTRQPIVSGFVPYLGRFPPLVSIDGYLKEIRFLGSGAIGTVEALLLVKLGYSTLDCGNPDAVIVVRKDQSTTDMQALFGSPTPRLPVDIVACLAQGSPSTIPDAVRIRVTYAAR